MEVEVASGGPGASASGGGSVAASLAAGCAAAGSADVEWDDSWADEVRDGGGGASFASSVAAAAAETRRAEAREVVRFQQEFDRCKLDIASGYQDQDIADMWEHKCKAAWDAWHAKWPASSLATEAAAQVEVEGEG